MIRKFMRETPKESVIYYTSIFCLKKTDDKILSDLKLKYNT